MAVGQHRPPMIKMAPLADDDRFVRGWTVFGRQMGCWLLFAAGGHSMDANVGDERFTVSTLNTTLSAHHGIDDHDHAIRLSFFAGRLVGI